jgi:hypothetical protein
VPFILTAMPSLSDSKAKKKFRFQQKGGVALMRELIRFADFIGDELGIDIQIEGTERARSVAGGGKVIKLKNTAPAPSSEVAFTIRDNYSIVPGLIGDKMPTIGGVRLDHSTPPQLTGVSSGTKYVFIQLNFSITAPNGFLSSYTLNTAPIIVSSSSSPSDTDSVKHLLISTINSGVPSNPYANKSPIPITLWDNGYNSTLLRVGNL